jgi:TatA/E family protein of Tat protein translocase
MFNIGPQELLLILLVALVIVGPRRLPEISRTIGRGLREFRKAQDEVTKTIRLGLDEIEPSAPATARGGTPSAPGGSDGDEQAQPAESGAPSTSPDRDVTDVARTLGRGLAEIRRTRREIQRTFRIDLTDTDRSAARPASSPAPSGRPAEVPTEDPPAASRPDDPPTTADPG